MVRAGMGRASGIAVVVLLAGCAETDPYLRPGMWQPTGANTINLAAMVANPRDLVRGRGERGMYAPQSTAPVSHLWSGTLTPLPGADAQQGPSGPAAPAPPAGAK